MVPQEKYKIDHISFEKEKLNNIFEIRISFQYLYWALAQWNVVTSNTPKGLSMQAKKAISKPLLSTI